MTINSTSYIVEFDTQVDANGWYFNGDPETYPSSFILEANPHGIEHEGSWRAIGGSSTRYLPRIWVLYGSRTDHNVWGKWETRVEESSGLLQSVTFTQDLRLPAVIGVLYPGTSLFLAFSLVICLLFRLGGFHVPSKFTLICIYLVLSMGSLSCAIALVASGVGHSEDMLIPIGRTVYFLFSAFMLIFERWTIFLFVSLSFLGFYTYVIESIIMGKLLGVPAFAMGVAFIYFSLIAMRKRALYNAKRLIADDKVSSVWARGACSCMNASRT